MDKYERFEAWLRENGAKFEQVRAMLFVVVFRSDVGGAGLLPSDGA